MTKRECLDICMEQKRSLRSARAAIRENALKALEKDNSRYREVKNTIASLGAKIALTAISGDKSQIEKLKSTLVDLNIRREELLKEAGIGEVEYDCEICHDTGYVEGAICDCVKKAATDLYLKEISAAVPIGECRFENFDLSFYPDMAADGVSPKKRMTEILKLCREYAIGFNPSSSKSLLFMGNTGLGKTHLSLAIAYELIAGGYNVIYGSAYNLFAKMEGEHFGEHSDKSYLDAVNCDLLIIDDLGGEFVSPYIQSLVYNIINTRLLARRPTIINTNLSMADINERYTPRVASRLLGDYTAKKFIGNDIRQIKSLKK